MKIQQDSLVADITNYKIGGKARFTLHCSDKKDILEALDFIGKHNIQKSFVMGLGTNILFSDEYFDGAIIRICSSLKSESSVRFRPEGYVNAFVGESVDRIIQFSFSHNLIGLEWAGGLPGTIGGAVRGNAGAFGGEIKDSFQEAEIISIDNPNEISTLNREDLQFGYRESRIKHDKKHILLSCSFALTKSDSVQITAAKEKYLRCISYRKKNHPLEYPNCGSVFKNIAQKEQVEKVLSVYPELQEKVTTIWRGKIAMGYITKLLGFEKYKVGNAMISEKHGNYIVNLGGARFEDVKKIILDVQLKCEKTFGFQPETEVEIIE